MSNNDEGRKPVGGDDPKDSGDESNWSNYADEAKLYYERLEQTGKLIDIDYGADLTNLPAHVSHVRYPDGVIERVGYE